MKLSAKKLYQGALLIAAFFALLLVILRTVLVLGKYDAALGHFQESFLSSYGYGLCLAIAVIFFLFFAIITRDRAPSPDFSSSPLTLLSSAFAAFAAFVWILDTAIAMLGKTATSTETLLLVLCLLSSLSLIGYMGAVALSRKSLSLSVGTCLGGALFCVFYALLAYFNTSFTLNSPIKIFDQMTFLSLLLFFLAEARMRLGKRGAPFYAFSAMTAFVMTAADSLPGLIYFAARENALVGSFMHDFLVFALFLYVLARLVLLSVSFPKEEENKASSAAFLTEQDTAPIKREDNPLYDTSAEATIDFDRRKF